MLWLPMCRLFGFRSVIHSQVHRSLLAADNALGVQSDAHPDGWGVVYYVDGAPHVTRSPSTALSDQIFHRLSGVVASDTVLAHVRKATVGPINVLNCHPFQHGRWTMAHNGEIRHYARLRGELIDRITPRLRRFILGDTDSEVFFFLFLSHLSKAGPLAQRFTADEVLAALGATLREVRILCDTDPARASIPPATGTNGDRSLLTIVVTDGSVLAAAQGGKELYYSTHKTRCADRDECPHLSPECEAVSATGFVNHFIVSSEPLLGENVWVAMGHGEMMALDWRMRITRGHVDHPAQ